MKKPTKTKSKVVTSLPNVALAVTVGGIDSQPGPDKYIDWRTTNRYYKH